MPKVITFDLNTYSARKALKEIDKYQKSFSGNIEKVLDTMGDDAWQMLSEAYSQNVETGETLTSISTQVKDNTLSVEVGGAALWLEFGTGVYRNAGETPHPEAARLGMSSWGHYAQDGSGESKGASGLPWAYYDETQGKIRWTRGIQKKQYLYNTGKSLVKQDYLQRVFDKVFK